MYALNFERLGMPERKRTWLIITCVGFPIYLTAASLMPDTAGASLFGLINTAIAFYFHQSQKPLFAKHIERGGTKASPWSAAGMGIACAIGVVALLFAVDYAKWYYDEVRFEEAQAMVDAGEYERAEAMFKSYKESYPEETATYWNLMLIYEATDRRKDATTELDAILARKPNDTEALARKAQYENEERFEKARALIDAGMYEEAERLFKVYRAMNSEEPAVYWNLMILYEKTGRMEEAKKELEAFLNRNPNSDEGKAQKAHYDDLDRFARAVALVEERKYREAEPVFVTYAEAHPDDASVYWNLMLVYDATGRRTKAIEQLERYLELVPDDLGGRLRLERMRGSRR